MKQRLQASSSTSRAARSLLHLIKKSEVGIADIPIAAITDQYLPMVEGESELNSTMPGECLVMAATLTFTASRMLPPARPATTTESDEGSAHRRLVQQPPSTSAIARPRRTVHPRCSSATFRRGRRAAGTAPGEEARSSATRRLGDLLEALRGVLERTAKPKAHEIMRPMRSVGQCVQTILSRFALSDRIQFTDLFEPDVSRGDVIVTFLALLELVRLRIIHARQDERFGAIALTLGVDSIEEAAERARDLSQFESWRGGGEGYEHASR